MSEVPTFTECRSTMVVPTYPEGGSHALQVCQRASTTTRLCESATLSGCHRDRRNTLLATAPADSDETFTVAQRTVSVKVAGGAPVRPSVRGVPPR